MLLIILLTEDDGKLLDRIECTKCIDATDVAHSVVCLSVCLLATSHWLFSRAVCCSDNDATCCLALPIWCERSLMTNSNVSQSLCHNRRNFFSNSHNVSAFNKVDKNSSGDEIANVNFLRRYGT